MKTQTITALAAAVLLAGVSAAAAADVASSHSGMAKPLSNSLSLPSAQQKTAWNDMSKAATQKAPAGFTAAAGAAVPKTLRIEAVPAKTARAVPSLRRYDFAKVQGKLLIVNPRDRKIAAVISG